MHRTETGVQIHLRPRLLAGRVADISIYATLGLLLIFGCFVWLPWPTNFLLCGCAIMGLVWLMWRALHLDSQPRIIEACATGLFVHHSTDSGSSWHVERDQIESIRVRRVSHVLWPSSWVAIELQFRTLNRRMRRRLLTGDPRQVHAAAIELAQALGLPETA